MPGSIWLYTGVALIMYANIWAQNRIPERQLLDAERDFAQAVAQQGVRDAFLAYLADDAVVFRPGPQSGKKVYAEEQPSTVLLSWHPVYIEASSGGDLGFTTGPYEVRRRAGDEKAVAFGEYLSIWKRQENGTWRVVLDVGTDHPKPASEDSCLVIHKTDAPAASTVDSLKTAFLSAELLVSLDRDLASRSAEKGAAEALHAVAADDIRILRGGAFPSTGTRSIGAIATHTSGVPLWQPVGSGMARSGDLGYTYGTVRLAGNKESSYVRIWRKERGDWKVVVDLLTKTR